MASQSTKTLYHMEQLQATPAVLYLNYNPFQNNFLGLGGGGWRVGQEGGRVASQKINKAKLASNFTAIKYAFLFI